MQKQKLYTAKHRHLSWEIPMPSKDIRLKVFLMAWAFILVYAAVSVIRPI